MPNAMSIPLDFKSCDEITPALIERAFAAESGSPRDQVLKLVEKMARVASPGKGAERILEVLARLAHSAWVDGTLDIVLRDFDLATQIDIRVDVGKHFERLRTISVAVPLAELAEWATENPEALTPLVVFDSRRDDELRLRKGSVLHVARDRAPHSRLSAAPQSVRTRAAAASLSAVPQSARPGRPDAAADPQTPAPPSSAVRGPMSAALRKSVPPPADVHARLTLPDTDDGVGPADVHRRRTPRVLELQLPPEAYPPRPQADQRKATTRIPAVRPAPAPESTDVDPTDEGWE
jgi:hypothetical protein